MKRFLSFLSILALVLTILPSAHSYGAGAPVSSTEDDGKLVLDSTSSVVLNTYTASYVPQSETKGSVETAPLPFTDVSKADWFYGDVSYVYAKGFMRGINGHAFDPMGTLSRAQAVTALYRIAQTPDCSDVVCTFEDVNKAEYYYPAVLWAVKNGIVSGTSPERFRPETEITREQMATILYRYCVQYLGLHATANSDLSGFADSDSVQSYALETLSWAVGVGLIRGIPHSTYTDLEPAGTTTRAQMASMLCRLCALEGVLPDNSASGDTGDSGDSDENEQVEHSSAQIVDFIKGREGFSANPYWDYSQWTVGYGTCCRDENGNRVTSYDAYDSIAEEYFDLTEEEGEALLIEALAENYEVSVSGFEKKYGLRFSQGEFDALVSFTFNLGAAWTSQSYMLSRCLAGTGEYADGYTDLELMKAMGAWCRVAGNVATGTCDRRLREASIFLYDDYDYSQGGNFCFVRYKGNGSYLKFTSSGVGTYTDDVDYFIRGLTYGELMEPTWSPVTAAASLDAAASTQNVEKTFAGWYTSKGDRITDSSVVNENQTLTAKWTE